MASTLLFSWPDIVANSTAYDTPWAATYYAETNLYGGDRIRRYIASSASTGKSIAFDLGSGITQEPDHVIVSRIGAIYARDTGTTAIRVKGSSASNFATGYNNSANITELYGPQQHDYIRTISPGAAYRYWYVGIETTDSVTVQIGKIYIGNFFDIGRDPLRSSRIGRTPLNRYSRRCGFAYELRYQGITDAKRDEFQANILSKPETPIFLYDTSNSRPLLGQKLLHARIVNVSHSTNAINRNNLTLTIEEVI